jgi:hypothetical protein
MDAAFVIMKIGDKELDNIWRSVYIPAIKECGLDPKRVDKHNEGRLLTSEIAEFIKKAKIIVADLTSERPNCYLEIGYAMGIGKFTNLILCAKSEEKVHFDLSGYELIRWAPDNLEFFKNELIKKIKYRLQLLSNVEKGSIQKSEDIENWIENERKEALGRFNNLKIDHGYLEVIFLPSEVGKIIIKEKDKLLEVGKKAECHNTGWPIGVVLENRQELRPKKVINGIRAIIDEPSALFGQHFDYWMLRNDGPFYFMRNFDSESRSDTKVLFFDVRVYRLAEVFLYCTRLYKEFGLKDFDRIEIRITHAGLKNRKLEAGDQNRLWFGGGYENTTVDSISYPIQDTLSNIFTNLKSYVYEAAKDLFEYFEFDDFAKSVSDSIVDQFLKRSM